MQWCFSPFNVDSVPYSILLLLVFFRSLGSEGIHDKKQCFYLEQLDDLASLISRFSKGTPKQTSIVHILI